MNAEEKFIFEGKIHRADTVFPSIHGTNACSNEN